MDNQRVTQEVIATGTTVYGQVVTIHKNQYSRPLAGVGDTTFSVSVSGTREYSPNAVGFVSLEEVRKYLHSVGESEYTTVDRNGQETTETRKGLGIPRGMVTDFEDGSENKSTSIVENPVTAPDANSDSDSSKEVAKAGSSKRS